MEPPKNSLETCSQVSGRKYFKNGKFYAETFSVTSSRVIANQNDERDISGKMRMFEEIYK